MGQAAAQGRGSRAGWRGRGWRRGADGQHGAWGDGADGQPSARQHERRSHAQRVAGQAGAGRAGRHGPRRQRQRRRRRRRRHATLARHRTRRRRGASNPSHAQSYTRRTPSHTPPYTLAHPLHPFDCPLHIPLACSRPSGHRLEQPRECSHVVVQASRQAQQQADRGGQRARWHGQGLLPGREPQALRLRRQERRRAARRGQGAAECGRVQRLRTLPGAAPRTPPAHTLTHTRPPFHTPCTPLAPRNTPKAHPPPRGASGAARHALPTPRGRASQRDPLGRRQPRQVARDEGQTAQAALQEVPLHQAGRAPHLGESLHPPLLHPGSYLPSPPPPPIHP
jgi:hypothetical protein